MNHRLFLFTHVRTRSLPVPLPLSVSWVFDLFHKLSLNHKYRKAGFLWTGYANHSALRSSWRQECRWKKVRLPQGGMDLNPVGLSYLSHQTLSWLVKIVTVFSGFYSEFSRCQRNQLNLNGIQTLDGILFDHRSRNDGEWSVTNTELQMQVSDLECPFSSWPRKVFEKL